MDDPLETTAVHFGGGLWGVIATPLFVKGGFWNNPDSMPVSVCLHNIGIKYKVGCPILEAQDVEMI